MYTNKYIVDVRVCVCALLLFFVCFGGMAVEGCLFFMQFLCSVGSFVCCWFFGRFLFCLGFLFVLLGVGVGVVCDDFM